MELKPDDGEIHIEDQTVEVGSVGGTEPSAAEIELHTRDIAGPGPPSDPRRRLKHHRRDVLAASRCAAAAPALPRLSRRRRQRLGIDRVLWLHNGIAGDDTHGHIDDLARFTDRETVVIASEDDRSDINYAPLRENWKIVSHFPVRARKLPMPAPLYFEGQRLPASYANFYVANQTVLVPTFNDPNDRVALNVLAECFPDRKVVGINCVELIWGLGTLHCMTQQQPAPGI